MHRCESYNTKQKEHILDIIKKQEKEFTIKDIYNDTKQSVGLTTIYRLIDKLMKENKVSKTITKDNQTYYYYLKECGNTNHFYLKCSNCSRLEHIDCDCIKELKEHITKNHQFKPNTDFIIINGICAKCFKSI